MGRGGGRGEGRCIDAFDFTTVTQRCRKYAANQSKTKSRKIPHGNVDKNNAHRMIDAQHTSTPRLQVVTGMPSGGGGVGISAPTLPESVGGVPDDTVDQSQQPPVESKRQDPLAGMIPEAPTDHHLPLADSHSSSLPPASSHPAATTTPSAPAYHPPAQTYGEPTAPAAPTAPPAAAVPGTPDGAMYLGGPAGGVGQSPYAMPGPAAVPAPYVAPVVPSVPAPAPAAVRPNYKPAPARPKTPVPSASGSRRSGAGGRPMEGNMADAMEHCRFAIRALEHKDVELAVQKLHEALQQIT